MIDEENMSDTLWSLNEHVKSWVLSDRLIVESSFGINLLTRPEYSVPTFWPGPNTRFQHSDPAWYRPRIDTRFEFPIRLVKKSKMTSNVKIYYFWIYYVIIFERLTWNKWIYFSSRCLHYLVALSDIQINISSTLLHVLTSWIENFESILDLNLLTQLKYSSQIFWLDLNTWVKNSDSNQVLTSRVLDLNLSTWLDAISLSTRDFRFSCFSVFFVNLFLWDMIKSV